MVLWLAAAIGRNQLAMRMDLPRTRLFCGDEGASNARALVALQGPRKNGGKVTQPVLISIMNRFDMSRGRDMNLHSMRVL